MSEILIIAEARAILAGLRRQQVADIARSAIFVGTLLLAWISVHPFGDLSDATAGDVSGGKDAMLYALFGVLACVTFGVTFAQNKSGLASLVTREYTLLAGWLALTVVLSSDPSISIRRLTLSALVFLVTASMLLLPKSQGELTNWLKSGVLALLAIC